ncbi:hypothetical protein [Halorarius litoreus]|nr:hypothetical protein [Halorarius litoreus]
MAAPERGPEPTDDPVALSAHSTSPDRTVFTEPGNCEAWLSTDYTVTCER